jgi:hypothetical protein
MPPPPWTDDLWFEDKNPPAKSGLVSPVQYQLTVDPDEPDELVFYRHSGADTEPVFIKLSASYLNTLEKLLRKAELEGPAGKGVLKRRLGRPDNAVYKAIEVLRKSLHDSDEPHRLIENMSGDGYRFCENVWLTKFVPGEKRRSARLASRTDDSETHNSQDHLSMAALDTNDDDDPASSSENEYGILRKWDGGKWFSRIIQESLKLQLEKNSAGGTDGPSEHIRILTTAFSRRVKDRSDHIHGLTSLLDAGVRVSVLLINPAKSELMEARHGLRADYPKKRFASALEWAIAHANEQIEWLADLISEHPDLLEGRLTDYMPPAFVIRNSARALIGFFVAFGSFADVPLLEITPDSSLWQGLERDWEVRWAASENTPVKPSAD